MKIDELPVSEVMEKDVLTVKTSTTLIDLVKLMRKTNQHMFPVVDNVGKLIGIVNYRGICSIFRPFSRSVSEIVKRMPFVENIPDEDLNLELSPEMGMLILVDDIVNTNFVSVKHTAQIKEARRIMRLHNVEMLPVVEDNKLVGMLSLLDLFVYIFKEYDIIKK
jgi:acetoin utilization protein AcuB